MKCRLAKNTDLENVSDILATAFSEEPVHKLIFSGRDRDSLIDVLRNFFPYLRQSSQANMAVYCLQKMMLAFWSISALNRWQCPKKS